jgi:hypothetical protein
MRAPLCFLAVSTAFVACSSEGTTSPDAGPGDASAIDAPKDRVLVDNFVPSCAMTMACDEGSKPSAPNPECIVSFQGKLIDSMGSPIANETVYLCGTNLCTSPLKSDPMGIFAANEVCNWFLQPAVKYLGGTKYASFASATPSGQTKIIVPDTTLTALPAQGVTIPPSGTITSNNVSLVLGNGTVVKFDPSEPTDAESQKFRAVEIPIAKAPPFMDASLKIETLWGLAPVNAALNPPAKLIVPNTKNWPMNTVVEFFLNGVDTFDLMPPAPYGKFGPIGTGKVTANGVETDTGAGNGLPMLGMVGIRVKP